MASRRRSILVIFFCIFAILQSGFRDINQLPDGNDTPVYQRIYNETLSTSWDGLINHFSFYSSDYDNRDSGYPIFIKLTQTISSDFTFFMFITAIVFIVPFGMLIYRYVKSYLGIVLAFLIYFTLFENIVNSFMRQAVTLGMVLMALRYIKCQGWMYFYGFLLIAFTIHSSAIIAFPFYFLPRFCKSRKWLLLVLFMSPILVACTNLILSHLIIGSVYENYASDDVISPMNYMLFIVSVSVLSYLFYNKLCLVKDYEMLISGVMGAMLFLPIVFLGGTMLRISYYYAVMLIPLIPVIIDIINIKKVIKIMVYFSLFLIFLVKFV